MPVIVIGADTPNGVPVIEGLMERAIEVRAFVTDPDVSSRLRQAGVKVATGDVSDGSHVEAAALRCFCAVVLAEAASDGRERAFSENTAAVHRTWLEALKSARVSRIIWVDDPAHQIEPATLAGAAEEHVVLAHGPNLPARVAALENAVTIS